MDIETRPSRYTLATAIIAGLIVYGSLYPFSFYVPGNVFAAFRALVHTWADPPIRGDFIANILEYAPFGLFAMRSLQQPATSRKYLASVIAIGAGTSITLELIQFYVHGRYTAAEDVYANVLGVSLGAITAQLVDLDLEGGAFTRLIAKPIPTMLLATWLTYEFFPYLPSLQPRKYWAALAPLLMPISLNSFDMFEITSTWLILITMIEVIMGEITTRYYAPLFAVFTILAEVLIVDHEVSDVEVVGIVLAYSVWLMTLYLEKHHRRWFLTVLSLCLLIAEELIPFQFQQAVANFEWLPFRNLLDSSSDDSTVSFLKTWFRYGSFVFLAGELGFRGYGPSALLAVLLLLTSWVRLHEVDHSGEITNAIIALMVGAIIAALHQRPENQLSQATQCRRRTTWFQFMARMMTK